MFAVLFNVAMTCQFVWTDVLSRDMMFGLWTIVGLIWLIGLLDGLQYMITRRPAKSQDSNTGSDETEMDPQQSEEETDLFVTARDAYLQANWVTAKELASQLVQEDRKDVAAWLLLIAVNRRCNELEEASRLLKRLTGQVGSGIEQGNWSLQVQQEANLIEQARKRLARENVAA